jgi:hypothetical protein
MTIEDKLKDNLSLKKLMRHKNNHQGQNQGQIVLERESNIRDIL